MLCHDFAPSIFCLTVQETFEGASFRVSQILGLEKLYG